MNFDDKILVTGHNGLVGSNVILKLLEQGYNNVISVSRKHIFLNNNIIDNGDYDLTNEECTFLIFGKYVPRYVINCAAKVGGIYANEKYGADFIRDNILIQTNIINMSHKFGVTKLLTLGSSCIYPKNCKQPIKEEYILTSPLEKTNIGYAIAKISGIIMSQLYNKQYGSNFICAMPTNIYGPNDNFNTYNSHLVPAVIRKLHEAKIHNLKSVEFWGDGTPTRELLYVEDLAEALIFLMNNYDDCNQHINIGTGDDSSIAYIISLINEIVKYDGEIYWNNKYPNGTLNKRLDVSKINKLGWSHKTSLRDGFIKTYDWYIENLHKLRK